ncbi:MAG: hypothetical protein LKI53_09030 [Bacteroidales bacterium]|jgi:chromosome segregation ATPase|nr:hypothetical protein [Bacteroidales bacterium]
MDADGKLVRNSLEEKIKVIISRYESTLAEAKDLRIKFSAAQSELDDKKNIITNLEKKIELLQTEEAFMKTSSGAKEAKQKIGKIVREIDKCISLLNE